MIFDVILTVIVTTCISASDLKTLDINNQHSVSSGFKGITRARRAVFTIGVAVRRGMKATADLLKNTKPAQSNNKYTKEFEKPGTFETAKEDFYSVYPAGAREFLLPNGNKGIFGAVGDRTLLILDRDDYSEKPIMKIIRELPSGRMRVDRITYTD